MGPQGSNGYNLYVPVIGKLFNYSIHELCCNNLNNSLIYNNIVLYFLLCSWHPPTQAMHEVTHTIQKMYERPIESFGKLTKKEKWHWFLDWKVI